MAEEKLASWRHLWLLAKGGYERSDNPYGDMIRAQAAHTCSTPRLRDVVTVLQSIVLEHIGSFRDAKLAAQAAARLLEYEQPYAMGEDNRTFMQRRADACLTYMTLQVLKEPDDTNSFVLGDMGEPDPDVLPVKPGVIERIKGMKS